MEQLIHSGKFDFLLTKPISPLFYATNRIIRVRALSLVFSGLVTTIIVAVYFSLSFTFPDVLRSLFMAFWGIIMMYAVSLTVNCFLFRNSQIGNVNNVLGEVRYQGRYPFDIFSRTLYTIFTTILPVAFFGYFAAAALFGKLDFLTYAYVPFFSSFVFALSVILWKHQVKYYSSASS
jgi:ABC-2 type transport system permease protein